MLRKGETRTTMLKFLLLGRPGSGKTFVARDMWRALPNPEERIAVDSAWLHHGAGFPPSPWTVPFRAPHYTVSQWGLVGSRSERRLYLGEASLSHGGCLFLDELPEFRRVAIQHLSEVLRKQYCMLGAVRLPAAPALVVATANLCDCGPTPRGCKCAPGELENYWARLNQFTELLELETVHLSGRSTFEPEYAVRRGA